MNSMSINNNNNSQSSCKVISKYFKTGMDESLSDFQEKKKKCTGPKSSQRQNPGKIKARKTIKRIRGQKDIRTILKSNKSELISYTKEFNEICKQSGVDVDSEQLQLAIALSKSLQSECQTEGTELHSSESLNSQKRYGKIRTTLQEYGFRIPEIKISSKSLKQCKKIYKLLLITESERQQVISDKYSQLLFKHLNYTEKSDSFEQTDFNKIKLYYLSTSVSYEIIKNNDLYYIENLIEKSPSTVGSLLRDWSEIPGRPVSPNLTRNIKIKACEIDCSQDDLDVILSGSLLSTKKILVNRNLFQKDYFNMSNNIKKVDELGTNLVQEDSKVPNRTNKDIELNKENVKINVYNDYHSDLESLTELKERRSLSPDMFADEISLVEGNIHTVLQKQNATVEVNNDVIDLTECVNVALQKTLTTSSCVNDDDDDSCIKSKLNCQVSHKSNITRKFSNDLMEITECVVTSPKRILENNEFTEEKDNTITEENNENIDLTQSSDSNDSLPLVHISGSKNNNSLDDTIILNDVEIKNNNLFINTSTGEHKKEEIMISQNVFEEYFYQCSDDSSEKCTENIVSFTLHTTSDSESNNSENVSDSNEGNDITQNSKFAERVNSISENNNPSFSLEKKADISTEYDEASDVMNSIHNSKLLDGRSLQDTKDFDENILLYQNSEPSMIVDNEFHSSLCKSKSEILKENFNLGGISTIDDMSNVGCFNEPNKELENNYIFPNRKLSRSKSESSVDVRNLSDKNFEINAPNTPNDYLKNKLVLDTVMDIKTPRNSKYIVKTNQVTPMLDYESMSTPEINKELGRYGLKPFKRKKAIQLLTHVYNQTHPFIEMCANEELQSPPKKRKRDSYYSQSIISPKKISAKLQFKENIDLNMEKNIYKLTNEVPVIRDISCNIEDCVFQKREKAKVNGNLHSCRVPLHIAFHNYVTCRRGLWEAILRYEPVDIDVVHKELASSGYKYDFQDLLKFMDKKCITVKTTDNDLRNKKSKKQNANPTSNQF